jgi:hypothetical protein
MSAFTPGNVKPSLAADSTDIELDGQFSISCDSGALQFLPDDNVVQSYKTLINRKNTE